MLFRSPRQAPTAKTPNRPPRSPNTPEKTVPGRRYAFRGPFFQVCLGSVEDGLVFWRLELVLGSFLPARLGIVFSLARLGPPPGRWGQAVSWRLCRLETTRALWVLCRFTDGAGKTVFSFVGKWCVLSCSCFLPAWQGAVYPPARRGPKPLFLLPSKRKSGSGLRKRKGKIGRAHV